MAARLTPSRIAGGWTLTRGGLLGAGIVLQLIAAPSLWGHTSAGGTLLGRYTPRYGAILLAQIAVTALWLIAYARRR